MPPKIHRIAFLLENLRGGGVQRTSVSLANALVRRGHAVEILVMGEERALAEECLPEVRVRQLPRGGELRGRWAALRADPGGLWALARPVLLPRKATRAGAHLPALARHLVHSPPTALISATAPVNVVAVLARQLVGWPGRLVLTERTAPSTFLVDGGNWRKRHLPLLMRRLYPRADAIVAVSQALAQDLAKVTGLTPRLIRTIYNPIVGPELLQKAAAPVPHPWLADQGVPVILAAGRLDEQKDFPTLLRAFARVRAAHPARLIILGGARHEAKTLVAQAALRAQAVELGVGEALHLPGFVANPFAWLARADLFVLSSRYEGLPGVLVQAMALGCPVVSTDCPTGPREILEGGRLGPLTPVGDDAALAAAILETLARPPARALLRARADDFSVEAAVEGYLELLEGETKDGTLPLTAGRSGRGPAA